MLAVEDPLGTALGTRLLEEAGIEVTQVLGEKGNGWLRKNARKLNQASATIPVVMLTDQDAPTACPLAIIEKYLGTDERKERFILRVCVLEAESWVLADARSFSALIGCRWEAVPHEPDTIPDPKEHLVRLAAAGKNRAVRRDLVPAKGSTAKVGPSYNATLREFVETRWDSGAAAQASPSLARAVTAISRLKELLESER